MLGTFILVLLVSLPKVTTQVRFGRKFLRVCAEIIHDHDREKRLKYG